LIEPTPWGGESTPIVLAARTAPELCMIRPPLINRGRAGMPGARCTRSLACKMQKAHELATTVAPGSPRHSRTRMVLTASFVLPGDRLYCHRHLLTIIS
jgi:hypothetical protein